MNSLETNAQNVNSTIGATLKKLTPVVTQIVLEHIHSLEEVVVLAELEKKLHMLMPGRDLRSPLPLQKSHAKVLNVIQLLPDGEMMLILLLLVFIVSNHIA